MIETINKFREYLDYIERHYDNVQKSWVLIKEKCDDKGFEFMENSSITNMIDIDVAGHDMSKLSAFEFTQYRQRFFPTEHEEKNEGMFELAWDHHKTWNSHHWQTWTTNKNLNIIEQIVCLVTNVVDWVAMGYEFNSTAKEYYEKNRSKIVLPDWAVKLMYQIFDCIYE